VAAQLAKLLPRISHPLCQAFLVNVFNTSGANAGEKEWTVCGRGG
jgi:hypothetical protein